MSSATLPNASLQSAAIPKNKQLAGFHSAYWQEAGRPLMSLVFIAPLLLLYEGGVLWLGPQAMRNGADVWLRQLLDVFGFGQYFLLPLLTVGILLAWHHTTHEPWTLSGSTLYGMLAESVLLACALVVVAQVEGSLLEFIVSPQPGWSLAASISGPPTGIFSRVIGYFGAGIYEEVLFRLMLMPAMAAVIRLTGASLTMSSMLALLSTSLLFSAAHYIGPQGQELDLHSFVFRFLAGGFFGLLFYWRGFGIAAGTHALYDILVGLY